MKYETLTAVYFSGTGTTKQVMETLGKSLGEQKTTYDLLHHPIHEDITLKANDLLLVGMPVYMGRLPAIHPEMLKHLKGQNTPAIIAVTYGNRAYDDALIELKTILEDNGFLVIGAGAFIAQHSIFPKAGKDRPDETDLATITAFGHNCRHKLETFDPATFKSLAIKGNIPYLVPGALLFKPSGNSKCNSCGQCVTICPVNAITKEHPRKTNGVTCIACGACIHICPQKARGYHTLAYRAATRIFLKKFSEPKDPEIFI